MTPSAATRADHTQFVIGGHDIRERLVCTRFLLFGTRSRTANPNRERNYGQLNSAWQCPFLADGVEKLLVGFEEA